MVDYMKESLRLLNENIDLNAELVRCRLKLKQAEAEVERLQTENAKLRKVAEAAEYFDRQSIMFTSDIEKAIDEYKTWKEGQE